MALADVLRLSTHRYCLTIKRNLLDIVLFDHYKTQHAKLLNSQSKQGPRSSFEIGGSTLVAHYWGAQDTFSY